MKRSYKKRIQSCHAQPNVSMYESPCNGGLPLDGAFNKAFQNGGGYFLDVGNANVIQPGVPPVQGYSECCHPVFNTSGYNGNGTFNDAGYISSVDGNPVCGGGRRKSKRNKSKRNKSKRNKSKHNKSKRNKSKRNKSKRNKSKRNNKSKRGGGNNSVFTGNMANRDFSCAQPKWNSSCI